MPLFKLSESIIGNIEDKDNTLHTDKTLQDFANDVELRDDKRDKEKGEEKNAMVINKYEPYKQMNDLSQKNDAAKFHEDFLALSEF